MRLHYLVKLKIRVFVKIRMLESETKEILLIDVDLKKMQLFDFDITLWQI